MPALSARGGGATLAAAEARSACVLALVAALGVCACDERPAAPGRGAAEGTEEPTRASTGPGAVGDPGLFARGAELARTFECNRCHAVSDVEAPRSDKDCVGCHGAVLARRFPARREDLDLWASHLRGLVASPSLRSIGARFRDEWLVRFLMEPHDLRPGLLASMPRLRIDEDQARALTAFLSRGGPPARAAAFTTEALRPEEAAIARGRGLFLSSGCAGCHTFRDAAGLAPLVDVPALTAEASARVLAPDLAVTRARFRRENLVQWIFDPSSIKPDTPMPNAGLSRADARALAIYVLFAPLEPPRVAAAPALRPLLDRRVSYREVDERVFHRTCRHCHADPAFAFGDGGPGNTGGLGFERRGLDLSGYEGLSSGVLVAGVRESVFAADASGLPRLVRALRARQLEEAGGADPAIRGMPLGHPAVSAEDLQLVRSWIAQGRPRD